MANSSQCCTHKKAACGRCNSGICSACCKCPKLLGRPRKHGVVDSKQPERRNEYRASRPTCLDDMVPEEISALPTDQIASKSNILNVYKLMGLEEAHGDINNLPSMKSRMKVKSRNDIDDKGFCTVERVFIKGVLGLIKLLLPSLNLPSTVIKDIFRIPVGGVDNEFEVETLSYIEDPSDNLHKIAKGIIISANKCGPQTSIPARRFLAHLNGLPFSYVQQLLSEDETKHSDGHIRSMLFQAKVDSAYLHRGLELPPRVISRHRMMDEVVKLVVDTIYSYDNISRLAWLPKKRSLLSLKQTAIDNIAVMKSLVLKRDVHEIYNDYLSKHSSQFPADVPCMKKSLFYTITREISGGSRKQASRAGVDYIKVNFHHDNFEIVEKIIDTVAPASDADQSLRLQLYQQKSTVFTFLSYTYAQHVLEGVKYQYDSSFGNQHQSVPETLHVHEQEKEVFGLYKTISNLTLDLNESSDANQKELIELVKRQLDLCKTIPENVKDDTRTATTHLPQYSLDTEKEYSRCTKNHSESCGQLQCGQLQCEACRCPFLFYDHLRWTAIQKLTDETVLADILVTIFQCERRTFRYMCHVIHDMQQQYLMRKARHNMEGDTVYIIFDFKQKFWTRGFREGGDAYYGKKGMQWFGMGAYVKPAATTEPTHELDPGQCATAATTEDHNGVGTEQVDHVEGGREECEQCEENYEINIEPDGYHDCEQEEEYDVEEEYEDYEECDKDDLQDHDFEDDNQEEYEEYEECDEDYGGDNESDNDHNNNGECEEDDREGCNEECKDCDEVCVKDCEQGNDEKMTENEATCLESETDGEGETNVSVQDSSMESNGEEMQLHFIDCIVLDDEKSDALIVVSCLEAGLQALHHRFPHLRRVIFQSDNAKNFAGKVTKMFIHQAVSACGMNLIAYYHNEAAAGKDICDSHFSHQQSRVEAYISEGEGGRKVSTPKQLAIALSTKCVKNTTVLLVKPKYDPPFMTAKVAPINGISTFLAATYSNPTVSFFHNLGQSVPSLIKKLTTAPCSSYEQDPFGNPGTNFSGCKVQFHNMGSERHTTRARSRYTSIPAKKSKRQLKKEEMECTKMEAIKEIYSIFPQCELCHRHFKSAYCKKKHKCKGSTSQSNAIRTALHYADKVLATRDFTLDGQSEVMITTVRTNEVSVHASFEGNFHLGWAHCTKNQHPQLSKRVEEFIAQCWQEGLGQAVEGSTVKSRHKVSAEAVQARLVAQYTGGLLLLSEVPVVGQIRLVYQKIGQRKYPAEQEGSRRGVKRGRTSHCDSLQSNDTEIDWAADDLYHLKVKQLKVFLQDHKLKMSGNKTELIKRIQEYHKSVL